MLDLILQILYVVIPCVIAIIGLVVGLITAVKKYKNAKTTAEKTAAINDIASAANDIVAEVENLFKGSSTKLKADGINTSAIKKDSAMAKLQSYAISKGYSDIFDPEYWSKAVDNIVALTRNVNARPSDVQAVKNNAVNAPDAASAVNAPATTDTTPTTPVATT